VEACPGSGGGGLVEEAFKKILVIQTAFIGDAILTLPLIQVLKRNYPQSSIDVVVVPRTAEIFAHHPAVSKVFRYDKRGSDKGITGVWCLRKNLSKEKYDLIVVPHRSFRSSFITWLSKPTVSVGFDTSAGRWMVKKIAQYDPSSHEIERNLSLLRPMKLSHTAFELPRLFPSSQDAQIVDSIWKEYGLSQYQYIIAVAPGTIWNTKRWPSERFASVCGQIASENIALMLVGGKEDEDLCKEVGEAAQAKNIFVVAGKLSLLQSAELISRCTVLLSNDSAPMHLAVAVGTPVVAIFGATIPEYGFAPRGPHDVVIETCGLKCRPCSIHGGHKCPIKTFDCMLSISPALVVNNLKIFLEIKKT
jgi:heptosyltransferase II